MYRISTNISKKNFESMISGGKGYLSSEVKSTLKQARMGNYLNKKSVRKDEALKVIKFLKEKGMIKGSPSALYNKMGKKQWEDEEEEKEEKAKKNAKAAIAQELSEEADDMAEGKDPYARCYDPRSQLGNEENRKQIAGTVKKEYSNRQQQAEEEKNKRKKMQEPRKKGERPPLADLGGLADLDIG